MVVTLLLMVVTLFTGESELGRIYPKEFNRDPAMEGGTRQLERTYRQGM